MSAPHVLVVPAEHFVTGSMPLGGIFQYHQAIALDRAGFEVGVLNVGVISPRFLFRRYRYRPRERLGGVMVFRDLRRSVRLQRRIDPERAIARRLDMGLELFEAYRRERGLPDVVHAHDVLYSGTLANEIRRRHGVQFVVTEHSSVILRHGLDGAHARAAARTVAGASALTAVSAALGAALEASLGLGPGTVEVLPNVLDPEFPPAELPARDGGRPRVFLTVGSLDDNKDHATMIRAFASAFPGDERLRIVGSGPNRSPLCRLAARQKVGSRVELLGRLDRGAVRREMLKADCFVLSSRAETFGVVLIEALSCGLPVVATRAGGPADIVTDANGLLVEPDDPVALAGALRDFTARHREFDREAIRRDCLDRFGAGAFVARARALYDRATASTRQTLEERP